MRDIKEETNEPRSLFITFEGGEGAGKSTQIKLLEKKLKNDGVETLVTREPGGTAGAEVIRHVILSGHAEQLGPDVEAMLFSAARSDHIEQVIRPALKAGKTVLCDRFIDSTRVYQGVSGKVDQNYLGMLEQITCEDIWPDLTLILDLEISEGMKRVHQRRNPKDAPDRFEKESMKEQELRRQAFLDIAKRNPERCTVIDASGDQDDVARRIWKVVKTLYDKANVPQ